jgi:aspartate carbamoyltransferase catalytic subunit
MKERPHLYKCSLEGKIIFTMFFEPSTRTRLSFERAIKKLGGTKFSTENANENSSGIKGETIEDTISTLNGLEGHAVVLRHKDDDSSERAAALAKIPIINAGSGKAEHPTQGLLDLYTIYKYKRRLNNLRPAFLGDLAYGRTNHSLITMLLSLGNTEIHGVSSPELALPDKYKDFITSKGAKYHEHYSLDDLPRDVDLIYHSRIQKERLNGEDLARSMFTINKKVLDTFSKDTILMHPLPRNEEIATCVDSDPRAVFFDQVNNGLYIRMAALHNLFNGKGAK